MVKRSYRWAIGGVVGLLTVGAIWIVTAATQRPQAEYLAELARGEAVGLPADPSLYQIRVADEDNAISIYEEAYRELQRFARKNPYTIRKLDAGELNSDYPTKLAFADLQRIDPVFTKLDEALSRPSLCQFLSYSDGVYGKQINRSPVRLMAKLRVFRARVFGATGRFDEAFAELARAAAISRHIGTDNPETIGMLVQLSLRAIVVRGLDQLLAAQGRNTDAIAKTHSVLSALGPMPNYRRVVRGEYGYTLGTLRGLNSSKVLKDVAKPPPSPKAAKDEIDSGDVKNRMFLIPSYRYQEMANLVRQKRLEYEKIPTNQADSLRFMTIADELDSQLKAVSGPATTLVSMMGSRHGPVIRTVYRQVARERLTRILAASLTQKSGVKVPAGCEIDPFTERPFLRSEKGESFKIWSVGRDMTNDGGLAIPLKARPDRFDLVTGYPYVANSIRDITQTFPLQKQR